MSEPTTTTTANAPATPAATTTLLRLDSLVLDPALQARNKLNEATVSDYARVYQEGGVLPAIKVAVVEGANYLVDGWHRVAALRYIGRQDVVAELVGASRAEALYMAMMANLSNGLQLKSRERTGAVRQALGAYIAARMHLKGKGRVKSLREINADLGNHMSPSTIRMWLWKDHRQVAKKHWGNDPLPPNDLAGGMRPTAMPVFTLTGTCKDSISNALAAFKAVTDAEERGQLISRMEEALKQMKEAGGWKAPNPDF